MKKCIKMYENKYKNIKTTKTKELEDFLQLIADLGRPINFFAIGGTAMVLKGIKESTKDIDFLTTAKYEQIKELFTLAGLREESSSEMCNIWYLGKTRIDIFYDEFILGTSLPDDWIKLSEHIRNINKIRLFILNWYDIIITKVARSEQRDIDDCAAIIKKMKIDINKLEKRYYSIAETSLITDYDYKFKHLKRRLK